MNVEEKLNNCGWVKQGSPEDRSYDAYLRVDLNHKNRSNHSWLHIYKEPCGPYNKNEVLYYYSENLTLHWLAVKLSDYFKNTFNVTEEEIVLFELETNIEYPL